MHGDAVGAERCKAQSITISPGYTTVGVNGTVQYTATVTGLANTTVTWSVNSVKGGNATYGTITTGGLYTAPRQDSRQRHHHQRARLGQQDFRTVYVAVEPAGPSISSISPNPIPIGSYTVTITGTGFKRARWSERRRQPLHHLRQLDHA